MERELAAEKDVTIFIRPNASIWGFVRPEYVSYTLDWWSNDTKKYPSWGNSSILNANLDDERLIQLASGLSPAFLRIGGSQADTIIYSIEKMCKPVQHCLTMDRWEQVLRFAQAVGARIVFTLNYLSHTVGPSGKQDTQDWDPTNAQLLLNYTHHHAPAGLVYGWELGNELTHGGKATNMTRMLVAFDRLRSIVDTIWKDSPMKPKIMGPAVTGGKSFEKLIKVLGPSLDVVTYHKYHGKGGSSHLESSALKPSFFSHPFGFHQVSSDTYKYSTQKRPKHDEGSLWIGEGAMAYNSGRANVTDTIISSLWYANLLGTLAKTRPLSHSVYCRQTLLGGNYELISHETLEPNPDYWIARLWRLLVGHTPIGPIESPHSNEYPWFVTWGCCKGPRRDTLLAHAFCAKPGVLKSKPGDVVFIMINVGKHDHSVKLRTGNSRSEYAVTSWSIHSKRIKINGKPMSGATTLPEAVRRRMEEAVTIAPRSVSFVVVHGAHVESCMNLYAEESDFKDENITVSALIDQNITTNEVSQITLKELPQNNELLGLNSSIQLTLMCMGLLAFFLSIQLYRLRGRFGKRR